MKQGGGEGETESWRRQAWKRKPHRCSLLALSVGSQPKPAGGGPDHRPPPPPPPLRPGSTTQLPGTQARTKSLEIHLSNAGALSRGGICGGRGKAGEERNGKAKAQWKIHFSRKTVTYPAAKGSPKKPPSEIGKGHREDQEGSKYRAAVGQGRGSLIWEQIYGVGRSVWTSTGEGEF